MNIICKASKQVNVIVALNIFKEVKDKSKINIVAS